MKKVNKTNMVRLVVTNEKISYFEQLSLILKENSFGRVYWCRRDCVYNEGWSLRSCCKQRYGYNFHGATLVNLFVLELPEYLLNEKGIAASQDFEDKVSRKEILYRN